MKPTQRSLNNIMNNYPSAYKTLFLHLLFVPFFLMAFFFYEERLYHEGSFNIFLLINEESFFVFHNRYVLLFSQWLPYLGLVLGLSLKTILILFSIGHVLFFYILFIIAVHVLHDRLAGIGILLVQTLTISHIFYHAPMSGILYGAGLIILFQAYTNRFLYRNFLVQLPLLAIGFLAVTSHPANVMAMGCLFLWNIPDKRKLPVSYYIMMIALLISPFLTLDSYENNTVHSSLYEQGSSLLSFPIKDLLTYTAYRLYFPVLMFLMVAVYYVYRHKWFKLILTTGFFVGYLFVGFFFVHYVSGNEIGGVNLYAGAYFTPIAIFLSIVFLYDLVEHTTGFLQLFLIAFVLFVIVFRMEVIYKTHEPYTAQIAHVKRLIDHCRKLEGSKFICSDLHYSSPTMQKLGMQYPAISMLLSSFQGPEKTITIIDEESIRNSGEYTAAEMPDTLFFYNYAGTTPDSDLNPDFFRLPPGPYAYLNTRVSNYPDSLNRCIRFKGAPHAMPIKVKKNQKKKCIPVMIENQCNDPIYSGVEYGIYFSYQWLNDQQSIPSYWNTPLEVDLYDNYQQCAYIHTPSTRDNFKLILYLNKGDVEGNEPVHILSDTLETVVN